MADVTLKRLEEFPAFGKGVFVAIRDELGISSFGINIERWPPNATDHPEHDELRAARRRSTSSSKATGCSWSTGRSTGSSRTCSSASARRSVVSSSPARTG
jgi:hypothetical protein